MDNSIVKPRELNNVEAFYSLVSLAEKVVNEVPQAVAASAESSSAYISARMCEVSSIDEQLKNARSPEEKKILWARRDAACAAIDSKDAQNKSFGLKVVRTLALTVTLLIGGVIWLARKIV